MGLQDEDTRKIVKSCTTPTKECHYTYDKNKFFTSQFVKLVLVIYGIGTPFLVWITVTLFTHTTDIAIIREKQQALAAVIPKLEAIDKKLTEIQVDIGKLQTAQGISSVK